MAHQNLTGCFTILLLENNDAFSTIPNNTELILTTCIISVTSCTITNFTITD